MAQAIYSELNEIYYCSECFGELEQESFEYGTNEDYLITCDECGVTFDIEQAEDN